MFTVGIQIIIELEREPKKKKRNVCFKPEMAAMGGDFDETMTRLVFKYFREINEFSFDGEAFIVSTPFPRRLLTEF